MRHLILIYSIIILFSTSTYAETEMPENSTVKSDSQHVVMIGASYLRGWPLSKIACLPVVNKGVSGEISTQIRERFDADALASSPVAVIIWGHINDFSNAAMDQESQTRQIAIDNLKYMIDRATEHGIIPIVVTEITLGMPSDIKNSIMQFIGKIMGKRSFQEYISKNVLSVNEWIRSYAKEHGASVLEIEKLMTNPEGNRKEGYYTDDLSHITEQAYKDIQSFALPFLHKTLIKKHGLCK
jgi:lysophospholipase L1-like esterase